MKVLKAVRLKNSNSLIGLAESGEIIHATVYRFKSEINIVKIPSSLISTYFDDTESYEQVSIESFNRMLRVASYRINNFLK